MLDYLAIFRRLNEAGVQYVVAGGMAVNLHGIPRMTYDIDLVLRLDDRNLAAFVDLMTEWGFQPRVPFKLADLAVQEQREEWIHHKHMKAFNLVNPEWAVSEIDILIDIPVDTDELFERAETLVLGEIEIPTVCIDHLIEMKRGTGRAQDEADLRHLERIRRGTP